MGLDTTHDCWHGPYSAFMWWRTAVAAAAGLPPLVLMEGFFERDHYTDPLQDLARRAPELAESYYRALPIRWDALRPSPLHVLLRHSDCDGRILAGDCGPIADALEVLLPELDSGLPGCRGTSIRETTKRFIAGLRLAASQNEDVEFH